jgi:hypothetical protein
MHMKTTEHLVVTFTQAAHELSALVTHALVSWRTEEVPNLDASKALPVMG